jgi:hypothetical protein
MQALLEIIAGLIIGGVIMMIVLYALAILFREVNKPKSDYRIKR